jgi:hypothetical protein
MVDGQIINPFVCSACAPGQATTGQALLVAVPNFTTVTVIILQQSTVMISDRCRHKRIAKAHVF